MKPLATDTHDFPSIRKSGCIYVDKTMFMYRLLSTIGTKLYFISRPRRFGKSLTVSAFKALFQGRRDLFKGLAIDATNWSWEKYPVIHFEFNDLSVTNIEEFDKMLSWHLEKKLSEAGYSYDKSLTPADNFGMAIETLSAANGGKGVAILCTLLASQGVTYHAESVQANGRADVVAEHKKGVFIFELKVGKKVDKAFRQIKKKGYAEPFRADARPIWLVGLCFDKETRNLVDCSATAWDRRAR